MVLGAKRGGPGLLYNIFSKTEFIAEIELNEHMEVKL